MVPELVQKIKKIADDNNLVLKLICDNSMLYWYNSDKKGSANMISFDFTNNAFTSFRINNSVSQNEYPIEVEVVDFDQIQNIRILVKEQNLDNIFTTLGISDIKASDVKEYVGFVGNRFNHGQNGYIYNVSDIDMNNVGTTNRAVNKLKDE